MQGENLLDGAIPQCLWTYFSWIVVHHDNAYVHQGVSWYHLICSCEFRFQPKSNGALRKFEFLRSSWLISYLTCMQYLQRKQELLHIRPETSNCHYVQCAAQCQ